MCKKSVTFLLLDIYYLFISSKIRSSSKYLISEVFLLTFEFLIPPGSFSKKNKIWKFPKPDNFERNPRKPERIPSTAPTCSYTMFLGTTSTYSSRSVDSRGLLLEVLTSWHHRKGGLVGQIWVHFSRVPSQVTTIILRKVLRHSPSRMSLPFELRKSYKLVGWCSGLSQSSEHWAFPTKNNMRG